MIVDEATDLPEGMELDLLVDDLDDLDAEEQAARDASIDRGLADAAAGRARPADLVLAELRARR
jgi:predicted transcriptional regulator